MIKFQERLASGRLPLRNELREGPHTAICAKARSNTVPFAASASSTGVWRSARRQAGAECQRWPGARGGFLHCARAAQLQIAGCSVLVVA